jgi:hypothetical protein
MGRFSLVSGEYGEFERDINHPKLERPQEKHYG